jgi:hypothetical protein
MIYEYRGPRWNDIDRGKTEELGEKPVAVPLCPPQIPYGLTGRGPGPPLCEAGDCRAMARTKTDVTVNKIEISHYAGFPWQSRNYLGVWNFPTLKRQGFWEWGYPRETNKHSSNSQWNVKRHS